ncbi:MAG: porin family protein [Prevotella sp.]|nr:porin family protein [Prevotella sp.]
MKKVMMTLIAAVMTMAASAQVYVGGSVGIASVKNGNADAETTYKILPEIGYSFNDELAVGVSLGYQKGSCSLLKSSFGQDVDTKAFLVSPYVRYTFLNTKYVNAFVDGGLGFASYKDLGSQFKVALQPGVAINFNDKFSFVAHFGFIGYDSFNPKADGIDTSNAVGVDLDANNITFGLYYNF